MKGSGIYIGKEGGDLLPVERRTWKEPWIAGSILVIACAIYEGAKLAGYYASEMTMYNGYPAFVLSSMVEPFYSILLILAIVLSCVLAFLINGGRRGGLVLIFIIVSFIMIGVAFFIVLARFMVDCLLLNCADPLSAWMIRYYWDGELSIEIRVLPDLFMNALCMIGIILASITLLSHARMFHLAITITEDASSTSSIGRIEIDGESKSVSCKVKNGIKACVL